MQLEVLSSNLSLDTVILGKPYKYNNRCLIDAAIVSYISVVYVKQPEYLANINVPTFYRQVLPILTFN